MTRRFKEDKFYLMPFLLYGFGLESEKERAGHDQLIRVLYQHHAYP
jgi:hypothetical protein